MSIILRVFIATENLDNISWETVGQNQEKIDSGEDRLVNVIKHQFDFIEVYLSPELSSVYELNDLAQISDKKINDNLILNLLEDSIAEDIEECKPLLLKLNEEFAYVTIIALDFYDNLIAILREIDAKKIKFIQSIVYSTLFNEDEWTICLNKDYSFIRTSLYEYYLLDDNEPIPDALDVLLSTVKAGQKIVLYTDNPEIKTLLEQRYDIECNIASNVVFGESIWNIYNAKSRKFRFKPSVQLKDGSASLLRYVKYSAAICVSLWLICFIDLISYKGALNNRLQQELSKMISVKEFSPAVMNLVDNALRDLRHQKGLYSSGDMLPLLSDFLQNSNGVSDSNIVAIDYDKGELNIFLNSGYDVSQFSSLQNILATKSISATLTDYRTFKKQNDAASNNNNNSSGILDDVANKKDDTSVMQDPENVITLQHLVY